MGKKKGTRHVKDINTSKKDEKKLDYSREINYEIPTEQHKSQHFSTSCHEQEMSTNLQSDDEYESCLENFDHEIDDEAFNFRYEKEVYPIYGTNLQSDDEYESCLEDFDHQNDDGAANFQYGIKAYLSSETPCDQLDMPGKVILDTITPQPGYKFKEKEQLDISRHFEKVPHTFEESRNLCSQSSLNLTQKSHQLERYDESKGKASNHTDEISLQEKMGILPDKEYFATNNYQRSGISDGGSWYTSNSNQNFQPSSVQVASSNNYGPMRFIKNVGNYPSTCHNQPFIDNYQGITSTEAFTQHFQVNPQYSHEEAISKNKNQQILNCMPANQNRVYTPDYNDQSKLQDTMPLFHEENLLQTSSENSISQSFNLTTNNQSKKNNLFQNLYQSFSSSVSDWYNWKNVQSHAKNKSRALPPSPVLHPGTKNSEKQTSDSQIKFLDRKSKQVESANGVPINIWNPTSGFIFATEQLKGLQSIFSKDKKQYIKKKWVDKQLVYSALLTTKDGLVLKIHGRDSLLTEKSSRFVAGLQAYNEINLDLSKTFQEVRLKLLESFEICEILRDKILEERNESYKLFRQKLENTMTKMSCNVSYAEDFLQLLLITNNSPYSRNSSLVLGEIINNKYTSTALKNSTEHFLNMETKLYNRNKEFPKFSSSASPTIKDLLQTIKNVLDTGIKRHKHSLLNSCPVQNSEFLCRLLTLNDLPETNLLYISCEDIKLFSDLVATYIEQRSSDETIPFRFIEGLWKSFYEKVKQVNKNKSIEESRPLTNSIYLFLFKSFRELILEISDVMGIPKQELLVDDGGEFSFVKYFSWHWPAKPLVNRAIEEQYGLIFKLMEHFAPGKSTQKKKFKYKFIFKKDYNKNMLLVAENRLVWLYILDCGLAHIVLKPNENFQKLAHLLFMTFVKFIKESQHESYESFRIVTHNITKFAILFCPYFSTIEIDNSVLEIDLGILEKQINFINGILESESNDPLLNHFTNLMDEYITYWKQRHCTVGNILDKFRGNTFEDDISKNVILKLLQIVAAALSKEVTVSLVIHFLRYYNQFLLHYEAVDFK